MRKTIFHSESVLHLESFFHFFYADSVLHLGSVFQSDLLLCLPPPPHYLFFHSDLFFTHSAFHSESVLLSGYDLQLNLVFHMNLLFFTWTLFLNQSIHHSEAILYLVIFSSLRLFFIQILLFIDFSLQQIFITAFNPNKDLSAREEYIILREPLVFH